MGVASPSNYPGSRNSATSWTDGQGNFWLFGGEGFDSTGDDCWLNDLWRYSSGEWTWMSGPDVCVGLGSPGVYGTQGVAAPGNVPGGRLGANSWTDAQGNLWLFGGQGESSTTGSGALNDLWKYSGGQWTWMSGSNLINQYGAYGTLGVAASGNVPGARQWAVTWIDKSGNLWLFGGEGNGSPGNGGDLNDLWKYNPGNGQWTWMGGSDIGSQTGIYGTQGVAAPGNIPPGRDNAVAWTDAQGNFWLFGGYAFTSLDVLNDLWEYSGGQWTWVSGSNLPDEPGAYGTKGVSSPSNVPGAREGSVSWIDPSGNLWLFGGEGSGELNDLWVYQP
jgi:N-acetylneuraminic acid mutarotase